MPFLFDPHYQAMDANGDPLSGAKLYFFQTGTTTAITTYQDSGLSTPHASPVVADASGRFAPVYLNTSPFKFRLDTSADVVVQTVDPAYGGFDGFVTAGSDIASASTINLDTATGPFVDITGTTSITTVTLTEGRMRIARATGVVTLTASSTLIVNGSTTVDYTTTADDLLLFQGDGSSVVRVWSIGTATPTSSAEIDSEGFMTSTNNLVIKWVTNATVDIDATAVIVRNDDGVGRKLSSVNLTVDITASGADGLDTGSEASSTWYHIWVIYNPTTDTTAGLLSVSATVPTLPSGYTHKGYVGACYNNGSSNITPFHQVGSRAGVEATTVVNANTTNTTFAGMSVISVIPSTAREGRLYLQVRSTSGTNDVSVIVVPSGTGSTETLGRGAVFRDAGNAGTYVGGGPFTVQMTQSQALLYRLGGTNAETTIQVLGYSF